jgi:hypothetical protein
MTIDPSVVVELARLCAIVFGILFVAAAIVATTLVLKDPTATVRMLLGLTQTGSIIRGATALVIVLAIVALRLLDKISGDATIATLSAIAGYVLGSEKRSTKAVESES